MKKLIPYLSLFASIYSVPAHADIIKFYYKPEARPEAPILKGKLLELDIQSQMATFEYEFSDQSEYKKEKITIHISRILSIEFNRNSFNRKLPNIVEPHILKSERPGTTINLDDPNYGHVQLKKDFNSEYTNKDILKTDGESSIWIRAAIIKYDVNTFDIIHYTSERKKVNLESIPSDLIEGWTRGR